MARVVVLAGGTGGAKLAAGVLAAGHELSVVANTGDDIELLGVHVSPDPDLCAYWLAGEIDEERGWGIADDGFDAWGRMAAMGAPDWFRLSNRDLGACLWRRELLAGGVRQTDAQAALVRALGVAAEVLPMCDEPVRTRVETANGEVGLQEFLIRGQSEPEIRSVRFEGIEAARPTPEVVSALEGAEAVVIGPSNPVISIGPILAVPGMCEAIASAPAPVVAVSPFVGGRVLKGPTAELMAAMGFEPTTAGVAEQYGELLHGLLVDASDPWEAPSGVPVRATSGLMDGKDGRRRLAEEALEFAASLR